mmetsp:Transcript_350/g.729  ORF Transcript_350/g.729 Transcript_350/m.729 type:complete len:193 (+) Transcript_350:497-1075(+)|eukprot:CAMPEP_0177578408 /NCGR_PEP_ID=MMETSP0419_2-20121207/333_1 /TAXON_ID=582737 /ORGANISM="Tetraselmis sp., Strain GSL018" /LENGTH=192 /DNA_ID=CAMNT_0019066851 /DNA_START=477 /DNA_END=1055 /DNA_ORIENTATION=+
MTKSTPKCKVNTTLLVLMMISFGSSSATQSDSDGGFFPVEVESPQSHRKLQSFSFSEAWSDFLGSSAGDVQSRAECGPNSFITTIRLSLNKYTQDGKDIIAIGSFQGICNDNTVLSKYPPDSQNDIYFIVKQSGFTEIVGNAREALESFMFVGPTKDEGSFSLQCPTGLRMSGYEVRTSSVVNAIKVKCSRV